MRLLHRLISIADEPNDDDDRRLRKRIGVVAGYVTIVAPLGAPALAGGRPLAWVMTPIFSVACIANLAVLARTRRFALFATVLLGTGVSFTLAMDVVTGGLGAGAGMVWTFLGPVLAILMLGPRRSIPWFGVFVAALLVAAFIDPWVTSAVPLPSYAVRIVAFTQNIGLPLGLTFAFFYYTDVLRRAAEKRSEDLLTNAIPVAIATRLKHGEERIAESYPETTVLFADIAGFTPWANETDPSRVVSLLDDLFTRFDGLVDEAGVEKVKTIGDAYMAVAGAPEARSDHAGAMLELGRGMLAAVAAWRTDTGVLLEIRIGIASGPVVAGVIGQRRLLFDLWGDTVNTASRLESHGVPGRIQISEATQRRLPGTVDLEPRDVDVKGLGVLRAFLVR